MFRVNLKIFLFIFLLGTTVLDAQNTLNIGASLGLVLDFGTHERQLGLEINAGHDLSLDNLKFFKSNIPKLAEVSIGHALISDALYFGLENTIQRYKMLLL